jgi:hypothetical protein
MNPGKDIIQIQKLQGEINQLRRAVEELSMLNEIAVAISSTLSLDRILDLIIQKCLKHMEVEQGAIMLLDEKTEEWRWSREPLCCWMKKQKKNPFKPWPGGGIPYHSGCPTVWIPSYRAGC